MKIYDQFCTIEQAKKLKELGIVQRSLYCHQKDISTGDHEDEARWFLPESKRALTGTEAFAAYNVGEIGMMLLAYTGSWSSCMKEVGGKAGMVVYCHIEMDGEPFGAWKTEAEARAAMMIYLLQSGKVTAEEVNQRLAI